MNRIFFTVAKNFRTITSGIHQKSKYDECKVLIPLSLDGLYGWKRNWKTDSLLFILQTIDYKRIL